MGDLDRNLEYELRTYAGYKGDERPLSLIAGGKEWKIEKIKSQKRIVDKDSGSRYDEFMCQIGEDTVNIRIWHSGGWTLSFLS
jgi:hypothetical protein